MFTFTELLASLKKGFRNGNWRKLNKTEKAFYRASLIYSKIHGKIVNPSVVEMLSVLVKRLLETPAVRILKRGLERAKEMLQKYEEKGVFRWVPQLKDWLKNLDYIVWLGISLC